MPRRERDDSLCRNEWGCDKKELKKEEEMTTIKIKGMTCRHCVMAVTKALSGMDGIRDVPVNLETGEGSFTEEKPVDRALIRERISKAGYEVVG